ncbi:helix-turn-helix transcriptional regulator [Halosimplex sp. TS25]|uniref:helix-turn-helix transcriptional regulator n=1 Tax=Halosimplex rarum TaxID=3396619 RepID=UPI0039EA1DD3
MAREVVAFLAGSPDRLALLDYLAEEPCAPRDVADALGVSGRSAQRNLAQFADRGWAEKHDGAYHLTARGRLVREAYADCLDRIDRIDDLAGFYDHLPDGDEAPDPAWLADATVVTADPDHPQEPVTRYVDAVRSLDTDRVRMLSPVLSRIFERPHAELVRRGASTDLILPADRVAAARERNPPKFETVLAVPSVTLYETDDPVDVGLTVTDERTFVLAYDADGHLRACVDGADPDLRTWAVDRFEDYRRAAAEVEGRGPF